MMGFLKVRVCAAISCILPLTQFTPAAPGEISSQAQIASTPLGASIEIRLKDKQKLRGARGAVSGAGFTLIDNNSGERQIAFDNVASVRLLKPSSHTGRNILIGVAIGVGAVAIIIVSLAHKGGYL